MTIFLNNSHYNTFSTPHNLSKLCNTLPLFTNKIRLKPPTVNIIPGPNPVDIRIVNHFHTVLGFCATRLILGPVGKRHQSATRHPRINTFLSQITRPQPKSRCIGKFVRFPDKLNQFVVILRGLNRHHVHIQRYAKFMRLVPVGL